MSLKVSLFKIYHDHAEVIRYLVAGGYNTVFGFLVFAGLYFLLETQLHYIVIAMIAQVLAITNAFLVYRYLVFRSDGNILHEYLKIYVVYGVTFVLSIVMLALLVELLGLHPVLAQFFVILVTVVVSYLGNSRFTFSSKSSD